jgi:antitoxin ParD1/3/4
MDSGSELTTMNVSLPRSQREFVEAEAARTGCTTTSEYVRRLIHMARTRAHQEELERKLIDGLESGSPIEVSPEYWKKKRQQLRARHGTEPS